MLTKLEAQTTLTDLVGRQVKDHELYSLVYSGVLPVAGRSGKRLLFEVEAVRASADVIRENDAKKRGSAQSKATGAPRPHGPLLTSRQAMERFSELGVSMKRAQFFKIGIRVAWQEYHPGHPQYYYFPEDIEAKAEELLHPPENSETRGLFSVSEAVTWINETFRETIAEKGEVTPDRFYHWIPRGQVFVTKIVPSGFASRYFFSEEDLRRSPAVLALQGKEAMETPPEVTVEDTEQLRVLEERYGPLVTSHGALAIIQRSNPHIKPGAVKARRRRGTLQAVGRFGNQLLFPRRLVRPGRQVAPRVTAAAR